MGKKSRIELIIPPNPYLCDERRNPPLGILYLAAVAEQKGYNVDIIDLRGRDFKNFDNEIREADVYGITAATPDYLRASEIAKFIKAKNPKAWTVIGGIHATSLPQKIDHEFDKIVIGEGEKSFLDVLEDFEKKNNEKRFYQSEVIDDLDSIPFPARHLLPYDSIFSKNAFSVRGDYAGTLITSRGCPNQCSFCGSSAIWGKTVRFRSPDNVVDEIKKMIEEYGIKSFRFQDDTMTLKKKYIKELCNKIGPLGIKWRTTTRVDKVNFEILNTMKQSGCEEVGYGIESLCQEVLDKNTKKIKISQIYEALENTTRAGLKSRLFFIIGLPGEPPGFTKRLEDFLQKTNPEGVDISTMVPYPGSPVFHHPEKYRIRLKHQDNFEEYHITLGLIESEISRPLTFVHDVLNEEEIIEERKNSLELIKKRKMVRNF